ncbi:MAG TPA: VOC family protein [Chitinophagaceae bacterium]|nr:VOC family protein [Chitinophagaceae bacterium]
MKRINVYAVVVLLFLTAFIQIKSSSNRMEARFTTLTLGVNNLEKAYKFYHEGLGLASKGIVGKEFEHGEVAFFDLKNGMTLALYSRDNLAWDSQLKKSEPSPTEFSIGYNTRNQSEVDTLMAHAKKAGAKIVKPAQKTFWGGYGGYFQDPDGHLWEIAYNPNLIPQD